MKSPSEDLLNTEIHTGITSMDQATVLSALWDGGRLLRATEDPTKRAVFEALAKKLGVRNGRPVKVIVEAMIQADEIHHKKRVDISPPERQELEDAVNWMAGYENDPERALLNARTLGGVAAIAKQYRDKVERSRKGKPGFATLFEEFRASLVDTKRMGYPLDVLNKDVRGRADSSCRALLPTLHRAHRMVLDDDFTALAGTMSRQPPRELARMLEIARPPFTTMWIEWKQESRMGAYIARNYLRDTDIPDRVGVLFWPMMHDNPNNGIFMCCIVTGYEDQCGPAPIGMVFAFDGEVTGWGPGANHPMMASYEVDELGDDPDGYLKAIEEIPIGIDYMDGVRSAFPEQSLLAEYIGKHATICLAPPFGPLHNETMIRARDAGDTKAFERQQHFLGVTAREESGLFRFLLSVFGLYQTGGGEFIMQEGKKAAARMVRQRPLPAYEYRILKLRRPTTPKIVKKMMPSYGSLGRRFHNVPQSWHHRRLATAECARHPKVCPIATWAKVFDEETGKPVGADQHECGICHRIKWLVPEHHRGDKKLGIIDKGYEITSSLPPSYRVETVVEELPAGVKIKSLPTFDAVDDSMKRHQEAVEARGK